MHSGVIAIVGRPNVGKSTIFNRIAGSRVSIVEDYPGVTRDRIYTTGEWTGKKFQLIDTGGIQLADQPYQEEIRAQVQIAMNEADVILFVVNGKMGMTDDDSYIAGILQKQTKPVVLAVNMIDDSTRMMNIYEFYNLGLGDPIAVSGVHGIGIGDVLDECSRIPASPSITNNATSQRSIAVIALNTEYFSTDSYTLPRLRIPAVSTMTYGFPS